MTEQVKYSRRYLKAKLYIAIPSLLFICNALLCTIAGYHFEKQRVKYSPTSPNFPISPNNTCEQNRWMAADFKAIDLYYSLNLYEKIHYWNVDLLSEQPLCPKETTK